MLALRVCHYALCIKQTAHLVYKCNDSVYLLYYMANNAILRYNYIQYYIIQFKQDLMYVLLGL